jgi:hypothetical protein
MTKTKATYFDRLLLQLLQLLQVPRRVNSPLVRIRMVVIVSNIIPHPCLYILVFSFVSIFRFAFVSIFPQRRKPNWGVWTSRRTWGVRLDFAACALSPFLRLVVFAVAYQCSPFSFAWRVLTESTGLWPVNLASSTMARLWAWSLRSPQSGEKTTQLISISVQKSRSLDPRWVQTSANPAAPTALWSTSRVGMGLPSQRPVLSWSKPVELWVCWQEREREIHNIYIYVIKNH